MMIIMTMMITIIIIIIIIIIIMMMMIMKLINTFDGFEVNFLAIYIIDNAQKIWVENKESRVEQENTYIGPSAFTWYDISLRLGV